MSSQLQFYDINADNADITIPIVNKYITDLAIHQNYEDHAELSESDLKRFLIDEKKGHGIALMIDGPPGKGTMIGMTIFFYTFSTWVGPGIHIEDLYIDPAYRSRGYGKEVFVYFSNKLRRLEWVCHRDNTRAKDMYLKLGATELAEWEGMRLDDEKLFNLAQ